MSDIKKAYLVDVGALLKQGDAEYSCYDGVYDMKHGYYDENQFYMADKKAALAEARQYVKEGVEKTYAVVSETSVPEDANLDDTPVTGEEYRVEDIVLSVAKIDGKIVEKFVEGAKA